MGLGAARGLGENPAIKRGRCCLFQSAEISLKEVWNLSQPQRLAEGTSVREVDCKRISIRKGSALSAGIRGRRHLKVHSQERPRRKGTRLVSVVYTHRTTCMFSEHKLERCLCV